MNTVKPESVLSPALLCSVFQNHNSAERLAMANNHLRQALPLLKADIPIIRSGYESTIAYYSTFFFKDVKNVEPVTNVFWKIDGKLYNVPVFAKYEHNIVYDPLTIELIPSLIKRNEVYPELKYGLNALVAYMNYYGFVYQDGIVVSESFAKRLKSLHVQTYTVKIPKDCTIHKINETDYLPELKKEYSTLIHYSYNKDLQTQEYILHIDKAYVIDIQIYMLPNTTISNPILVNYINKYYKPEIQNLIRYVGADDLMPTKQYPVVITFVTAQFAEATVGDKLSNRHGNKGVINLIVPDEEMPKVNNRPVDVIFSALSIPSRMNLGQLMEQLLAKITKKVEAVYKALYRKGKKAEANRLLIQYLTEVDKRETFKALYKQLENIDIYPLIEKYGLSIVQRPFNSLSIKEIKALAEKYKVSELEEVEIDGHKQLVNVGYQYILKLEHTTKSKVTGAHLQHTTIQNEGQRLGEMETWNLIAHDGKELLKHLFRTRSDNFNQALNYITAMLDLDYYELPEYNIFEIYADILDLRKFAKI